MRIGVLPIQPSPYKAVPSQTDRLEERHIGSPFEITVCGLPLTIETGVYRTSGDSELMIESVRIDRHEKFLEIGCGSGVVSLALAGRAANGVGVDINELAVKNSQLNADNLKIENVRFIKLNVFEQVEGRFDVIVCNPPYNNHAARDAIDCMFWDTNDAMKRAFFKDVDRFLKPDGRIYFGWADFADLDVELPYQLAGQHGFVLTKTYKKPRKGLFNFYVLEFVKKTD